MNQQNELFHDDIYSALRTDVQALGGSKVVGHSLRPSMKPDKAGEWLSQCLNPDRPEKLSAEETLFIKVEAKKRGSFCTVYFEMDEIGMSRPSPIEPEDEIATLQRQFMETVPSLQKMLERIEKLKK